MKDLFTADGHLTGEALHGLATEGLEELSRLEVAEHLSFCDECVQKYTEFLSAGELMQPPQALHENVIRLIRRKTKLFLCNRYSAATAAACFAIVFWLTGVFSPRMDQRPPGAAEEPVSITEHAADFTRSISNQLNEFLQKIQQPKEWFTNEHG